MRHEELTLGSVQIGETDEGGFTTKLLKFVATVDPASVAANTTAAQTFSVTGLKAGDLCIGLEQPPAWDASAVNFTPLHIDTDDELEVKGTNTTAGAVNAPSGDIVVTVLRPDA